MFAVPTWHMQPQEHVHQAAVKTQPSVFSFVA